MSANHGRPIHEPKQNSPHASEQQTVPDSADGLAPRSASFTLSFFLANEQDSVAVDQDRLQQIAELVLQGERVGSAEISVALVDDAAIHEVNRRFLNHDSPTDVISFSLGDEPEQPSLPESEGVIRPTIDGEIVISGETAARVAAEHGFTAADELALYLVHGLLHLCGYDDQTDDERSRMEQRQQSHLQNLGIQPHYP